ncbi:hypothetical protein JRO89_XS13G0226000 [Xanthoceras sorbifolium]|uniref:U6 snRNA-associated Sm-like protein LSm8 n=1 Tax=Xanthoceras sorbifolium TaxID=99658 RepID=A0ABQ8H9L0_9ROSI|nr:hypothetical protein JRO89_XS13G0226000 [Xanthoceras sorbifolium]
MVIGDYDLCLQEDEVTTNVYNVVATPSVLQRVKQSQWQDEELRTLWNRLINENCPLPVLQRDFQLKVSGSSTMSGGPGLESLVDQTISVITNDGRNIVGILKGFDQATNIILDESHERVYSTKEGVQQLVLGLYIIRGDNISIVGELDEELDSHLDLSNLRAHPLKPVIH